MRSAPGGGREAARLAALREYRLLDGPADDDVDAVVRLAALIAGVPTATLNLIDESRQCQLSTVGFPGSTSDRADSMCAVHFEDGVFVEVPDATGDARFAATPWVDGRLASVRFYASAPLVTASGHALGSLCVFDAAPGRLQPHQVAGLQDLARVLLALFEGRRQARVSAELAAEAREQRCLAELTMAEAEARWELSDAVAESIDVGLAVADAEGRLSMLNRAAREWHGLDADAGLDPREHATAYALYTADGVSPLRAEDVPLHRAIRDGAVQGAEIVIAPAGQPVRTVICSGRAMTRADGTPLGAVVAMTDVSAVRAREAALTSMAERLAGQTRELTRRGERLETLARASRDLLTSADPWEAICRAACEVSGADGAYLMQPDGQGRLVSTAMVGLRATPIAFDLEDERSLTVAAFTRAEPLFVADLPAHPDHSRRVVEAFGVRSCAWHPVLLPGERAVGVLGVVWHEHLEQLPAEVPAMLQTLASEAAHAIERADLLTRLAQAAEQDALTGLANRRRWDAIAAVEVARAQRGGTALSFALIDLDHFKRYNDAHGHLAGDVLLRTFADAASGCLREVDTLARWGGEEFILALPSCTAAQAVAVADRIRAIVPDAQTCTVGIAEWVPGTSVAELTDRADAALYRGKSAGRNLTVRA